MVLQVSDSGLFALRSMQGLKKLGLAGCASAGNGAVGSLGAITSLEELNLEWCSVGSKGALPATVASMSMAFARYLQEVGWMGSSLPLMTD